MAAIGATRRVPVWWCLTDVLVPCPTVPLPLHEQELRALFNHFDHDRNGKIHYMEFLRGVRGQMSETRRALVSQAFARIDTDQSGVLTYEDLRSHYNAKQHKDVLSGRLTEKQAIMKFLNTFDGLQRDGVVTAEEFEDYYANVSASVDDDAYFQLMMWNSWNLGGATTKRCVVCMCRH